MIFDFLKLSFTGLMNRSLRTWLTMIGIFIGIAAVVALISLGQGMQDSINDQFKKVGTNRIMITPGGGFMGPTGGEMMMGQIDSKDLSVIRNVKGVDIATGVVSKTSKVNYKNEQKFLNVWGFDTDDEADKLVTSSGFLDVEEGRQIKTGDKYKAIVGYRYAYDTFDRDIVIGSKITIEDKEFEVVGIQKNSGTGMHDAIIRIPLDVAREMYAEPEKISTIFTLTKEDSKPSVVAEDIKRALRRHRNVKEGEEDFSVQTAEQMISSLNQILDVVTLVVVGIAAISLIVGGIGIMNTMYTTVLERTREIGIMKSIGARNSHILLLFLIESGLLGLLGGVIGILIGLGISYVGTFIAVQMGATFFKASISVWLICGALAFSFVVGSLSGALPARQASKLQPVEALRE